MPHPIVGSALGLSETASCDTSQQVPEMWRSGRAAGRLWGLWGCRCDSRAGRRAADQDSALGVAIAAATGYRLGPWCIDGAVELPGSRACRVGVAPGGPRPCGQVDRRCAVAPRRRPPYGLAGWYPAQNDPSSSACTGRAQGRSTLRAAALLWPRRPCPGRALQGRAAVLTVPARRPSGCLAALQGLHARTRPRYGAWRCPAAEPPVAPVVGAGDAVAGGRGRAFVRPAPSEPAAIFAASEPAHGGIPGQPACPWVLQINFDPKTAPSYRRSQPRARVVRGVGRFDRSGLTWVTCGSICA